MSRKRPTRVDDLASTLDDSFKRFCTAEIKDQQQRGYEVGSLTGNSMAWYQWHHAARCAFAAKEGVVEQRVKRGRSDLNESKAGTAEEDALVAAIADCACDTVVNGTQSSNTLGDKVVECAQREAFPASYTGVRGMRELLSVLEVMMRVALAGVESPGVAKCMTRLRILVNELRNRGIVEFRSGGFPAVFVLLDLSSLDVVLARWGKLSPETRRTALDAAISICSQVKGEAAKECVTGLAKKRSGDVDGTDTESLRLKVQAMAASIPFDFPEECEEVIPAVVPSYTQPSAEFLFPPPPPVSSVGIAQQAPLDPHSATSNTDDGEGSNSSVEELSVGEVLQRHQQQRRSEATSTGARADRKLPSSWDLKKSPLEHPASATAAGTPIAVAKLPQCSRAAANASAQCCSRFHDRYADATKHASNECRFCATCHLLEIIFNGCKTDCVWKHWPTERRVNLHLSKFPQLRNVALDRLRRIERGEALPPYPGPL